MANGIPSHDPLNRVFAALNPSELKECFFRLASVAMLTNGRVISIDGKRACNAGTDGKKGFLHLGSAWCDANNIVIGQQKTDEKSNGIAAIPALLELLVLQGAIITIDAMGCQHDIAGKIVEADADYVLAVIQNQAFLLHDIKEAFEQSAPVDSAPTLEKSHGRIEKRTCKVITDMGWISKKDNWQKLDRI